MKHWQARAWLEFVRYFRYFSTLQNFVLTYFWNFVSTYIDVKPENKTVLLMLTILTMLQYLIYLEGT